MKNIITSFKITALFILAGFSAGIPTDDCNAKSLKDNTKSLLEPYKYDSSELTKITYKNQESVKEVEVPLFIGEKYRMVFNTEALPKPVEVAIYNKDKNSKKRILLYSSKEQSGGKKQFSFEPPAKSRKVFVDYVIPGGGSDSNSVTGCAVFVLGYK